MLHRTARLAFVQEIWDHPLHNRLQDALGLRQLPDDDDIMVEKAVGFDVGFEDANLGEVEEWC